MISAILLFLAAVFNAVMDLTESERFYVSVFRNLNERFWYKRVSWKYAKKIFGWKFDAWHVAKSLMIICASLAIVLYKPVFPWYIDFVLAGVLWNGTFNLFYNKILLA